MITKKGGTQKGGTHVANYNIGFILENIFSGGRNMGFLVLMKIWDVITKHRKENRARKRPVM